MRVNKQRFRRPQAGNDGTRIRPVFEDFHLLSMEGDYEYPRHQHTNYEVILVERGPYRCELNGEQLTLVDGQVLVIKPGDWHQDHLCDGQRHYVLHFRLTGMLQGEAARSLFRDDTHPAGQICTGNYLRDTFFMRELRREAQQKAPHSAAVQDSLLEALFWRLVRGLPESSLSETIRCLPHAEARREAIKVVFDRHLRTNPTVADLAVEAKMSPRHLTSFCRNNFGAGPARYLLQLKLRRAQEMLRYRGQRVKEVSDALGFANPYHFSRVYRRYFGHPPSRAL
ncbi:AraC family transcriptional regulator [Oleiharenicola lentus]|uniref:AraC family transcriptional regulator n=1 Tax=Oleiharenicola lentus TaxID=2508720 RepID=A0A4Q1CA61_9BACT|nr:AraC family transcriptional regulator [Oleiharenicola lentus]RXK55953.1 AraC family transcriptional regulator [Oleiharenicola lentus]